MAHRHIHSRPYRNKTGHRNLGVAASNRLRTRHGWANTRLAKVYDAMKARCHDPKSAGYRFYGSRGITVCEEWLSERATFFKWAEQNGYREGLQLDRENGHLGYGPENCRWVTQIVNQNNRRSNRRLTHDGQNLTVMEWSRKLGIPHNTIHSRLNRGLSPEQALQKTSSPRGRRCRSRSGP